MGGNNSGSAFQFAGRRIDFETGLYYNRARYYSPTTGRFLSPDPLGYGGGLNLYAYVGNDPVDFADPSGLAVEDAEQTGLKAWEVNTTRSSFGKSSFYIGLGKGGVQFVADNLQLAYITSNPQQYLIDKVLGNPTLDISGATANLLGPPADDTEMVARLDAQFVLSFAGAKGLGVLGRAAERGLTAAERVAQLAQGGLSQIQRERFVTLGVTETQEGIRVISSSSKTLEQSVIDLLQEGEVGVSGVGHAEVTGIEGARSLGLTPTGVAASRPICPSCASYLGEQGIAPLTPLK